PVSALTPRIADGFEALESARPARPVRGRRPGAVSSSATAGEAFDSCRDRIRRAAAAHEADVTPPGGGAARRRRPGGCARLRAQRREHVFDRGRQGRPTWSCENAHCNSTATQLNRGATEHRTEEWTSV